MFTIIRKETKKWEKSNIMIRLEKKEEHQKVENLVRESFWDVYRPGCLEHYVLHQLRNDPAFVPELDFVMFLNENVKEDKLIGQNMFMRASEFNIRYHELEEGQDASFFLCKELIPGYLNGITGEYATPEGYFVDEKESEEFDKMFPYKEKKTYRTSYSNMYLNYLSRLGDLAVFSACSSVIRNKRLTSYRLVTII